ncbi:MAG: hypothetical protein HBSAPP04_10080 [Ignavibacteriaceae bacterium]|nr:MAG: hypothetical protein HBSAPP04_10080 [Ignavibacteriaceae bacterium]
MNELIEKVKQFLSTGRHNSAIRAILEALQTSKGIERERLKTQLQVLLLNDEVKLALDDEMRATLAGEDMLPGFELIPDKYHFTGKAAFPVFNESGCRIAMLNCEQKHENKIIDFRADSATKGTFYTAVNEVWQFLQRHISAKEFDGNDVTVMNWGLSFSFHYNPFADGILKTVNDDSLQGDSFHFAALAATLSLICEKPVDPGFVFTGTFERFDLMRAVTMLVEKTKLILRERPSFKKIVIPHRNLFKGADRRLIEENENYFLEIRNFNEFSEKIFGMSISDLLKFEKAKRHHLGIARVIATDRGIKELTLYDKLGDEKVNATKMEFRIQDCEISRPHDNVWYNVFPVPTIYTPFKDSNGPPTMILINYPSANTYVGNLLSNNGPSKNAFAIGLRKEPVEAQIFAYRTATQGRIIGKYFALSEIK